MARRFKHELQQGGSCVVFCLTSLQAMFGSGFWKPNGGSHLLKGPFIFQTFTRSQEFLAKKPICNQVGFFFSCKMQARKVLGSSTYLTRSSLNLPL